MTNILFDIDHLHRLGEHKNFHSCKLRWEEVVGVFLMDCFAIKSTQEITIISLQIATNRYWLLDFELIAKYIHKKTIMSIVQGISLFYKLRNMRPWEALCYIFYSILFLVLIERIATCVNKYLEKREMVSLTTKRLNKFNVHTTHSSLVISDI